MKTYMLVDKLVVPCNTREWSEFMSKEDVRVEYTDLHGEGYISTVFLGLDHSFDGGIPLLFETMVFSSNQYDGETNRYSTYEDAVKGHWDMVERCGGKRVIKKEDCQCELDESLFKIE